MPIQLVGTGLLMKNEQSQHDCKHSIQRREDHRVPAKRSTAAKANRACYVGEDVLA
jgi:hypothetical protein